MATTTTIPTKSMPTPSGMPMTYGPWGGFNPTVPFGFNPSPMTTPPGASFYPPTMSKFPPGIAGSTGVPPMTGPAMMPTVPPPGYTPGFGPEAWGSFEPEPWTSFPPYSYRGWPLDVTNTFGPSNSWPMPTPFGPTSSWPMTNATGSTWPTNPTSLLTLSNVNFRPNNWVEFYSLTNPVRILDRDGNRMLFLSFDMRGFKPEEVCVSLNKTDRSIVIEANYEYKDPKEHQLTRKFYRKFVLPDTLKNVDLSKVDLHASLNVNGTLIVEAMLPRMTYEELGKWTSGTHMHDIPTGWPMPGVPGFGTTPGINFPVTCRPVNA